MGLVGLQILESQYDYSCGELMSTYSDVLRSPPMCSQAFLTDMRECIFSFGRAKDEHGAPASEASEAIVTCQGIITYTSGGSDDGGKHGVMFLVVVGG